jgi:Fe-S-cluster containining protein
MIRPQQMAEMLKQILDFVGRGVSREPLSDQREWVAKICEDAASDLHNHGLALACGGIGCNGCCRGAVPVTDAEWDALLPVIPEDAWSRVDNAALRLLNPDAERLERCPLLDPENGSCSVYNERPLTCRAYHSTAPSRDWCWPERVGSNKDIPQHPVPEAAVVALLFDAVDTKTSAVRTLGRRLVAESVARKAAMPAEWSELSPDELASVSLVE